MAWNDGLVDAFPIPLDRLTLKDQPVTEALFDGSPFDFLRLPIELRNAVYQLTLFDANAKLSRTDKRCAILRACRQCHDEAARVLYSRSVFRIFPKQEFQPLPSVLDVPPRYRRWVTTLDLTFGSSWTEPPRSWCMTKTLARRLARMPALHTLKVFVEADPSDQMFANFRVSEDFYTDFCGELLWDVLDVLPQVKVVELDGHSFVHRDGPLVTRLRDECEKHKKPVKWGSKSFADASGRNRISAELASIFDKPSMYS